MSKLKRALVRLDERGAETIEFLMATPLIIFAALVAWQLLLVGYTGVVAAGAAREGARAAAVGQNVDSAVRAASAGLRAEVVTSRCSDLCQVRVKVQVPKIQLPFISGIQYPWIYADATMRYERKR